MRQYFVFCFKKYTYIYLRNLVFFLLVIVLISACSSEKKEVNQNYYLKYNLAIEQLAAKNYDLAERSLVELLQEIKQEYSSDEINELKADTEYALGKLFLCKSDYHSALDYYNSAYVYYKELFQNDGEKTIDTNIQIASIEESYLGREESALERFTDIYETIKNPKYRNVALSHMVNLYIAMDNGVETNRRINIIKSIIEETPDAILESDFPDTIQNKVLGRIMEYDQYLTAYSVLGTYYIHYMEPDNAIKMYESALSFANKCGLDNEKKIEYYDNLGFVYLVFKGEDKANEYINKTIMLVDEVYPRGVERASCYITIAEKYLSMDEYDKFKEYLKAAVAMVDESIGENHWIVSLSKILLSQYHFQIGEYRQAIVYCEEAIEIEKNILKGDDDNIGSYYNNLANCYTAGGYDKEAIDAYLKSIDVYKRFNNDLQVAVADRNIALVYNNSLQEHGLALKYAKEAIALVDKMDSSSFGSTIAAIYMVMPDILNESDYEYAFIEEYAEKAYQHLQKSVGNVDEHLANYHYNLGTYLANNSRYSEACEHFIEAEVLFKTVYKETVLYPVDIFYDIALSYYNMGSYNIALKYFEKSIEYNKQHISLLNSQGNYLTSYWEKRRQQSTEYTNYIDSLQKEKPN
ncbi:MAG: tetratricopeptide repeat protein [Butyrivibrio sp.]|nr:tetratricopeptide repeat protein [Butyrivibrio sp.]